MPTDLTPRVENLLDPITGEVVDLNSPPERLAEWFDQATEWERRMREAKGIAREELLKRLGRSGSTSLVEGDWHLKQTSSSVEYDADKLDKALKELTKRGKIDEEAYESAIGAQVVLKPNAAVLNRLKKNAGPEVKEAIEACVAKTRPPSVTVKRA